MHPVLTAGFRPFFLAAAGWAVLSMILWLPLFGGEIALPSRFDPVSWHIHEMLFGFVMAAVAGFLLTAIPNWTARPPIAGLPLAGLAGLWLLGRAACAWSDLLPGWLAVTADLLFPVALAAVAARELISAGNRRNYPLIAPVVLLAVASLLMHLPTLDVALPAGLGWRLGITVIVVLISVIGGRIIPAFTRNWLNARGPGIEPSPPGVMDRIALGALHAGMIAWTGVPDAPLIGVWLLLAAALNLVRLIRWRGLATTSEPLLLVLHLGYLWLVVGVAALGASLLSDAIPGAAAVHALTAGAMGSMIIGMMTRVTLGHTGRPLQADKSTSLSYVLVSIAAALRMASAWLVDAQIELLEVSALAWIGAFALFLTDYGPMLLAPRR